ncbi:uncharacterized protein BO66DRAFT_435234 [Aspergillus aculeatinus CBS 121060]|uniref:Uncharacterized protein n=1 Tax=Aspergillus aculeatinus CBS 121060 TaxID=1448322 RepID=A0ACD1HJF6_9EURO|nr:hypothetical protein BO66DRAFT_435234 [Aspergillus aculeatinus CBS 121060]RAH73758.1 hypothetical protein BO66DRAFT_435234 [Aspergillus aculeatinus CBS 121060]
MWRKRKLSPHQDNNHTNISRKKRWKENYTIVSSDDSDHESNPLDDDEYYINCILDETESQYLIDWEGPWEPTWEPKEHANELAVETWEKAKKQRSCAQSEGTHPSNTPTTQFSSSRSRTHSAEQLVTDPVASAPSPEHTNNDPGSPLFVPFDGTPELQTTEAYGSALTSQSNTHCSAPPENTPRPSFRERQLQVFQEVPATPVPTELRLPGESPDARSVEYSRTVTPAANCHTWENVSVVSTVLHEGLYQGNTVGSSGSQRPVDRVASNHASAVDEVPETPFGPFSNSESQTARPAPTFNSASSQYSIISTKNPLSASTPVSQQFSSLHYLSQGSNSAGRLGSIPESVTARVSQATKVLSASKPSCELASVTNTRESSVKMDGQDKKGMSLAETMEKYSQFEGSTPREKLRNAYAQLRAQSAVPPEPSATPSSVGEAGDIEPSPVALPESAAPLSVRIDKPSALHPEHHSPVEPPPVIPSPPLEPAHMDPTQLHDIHHDVHHDVQHDVQTIQPHALSVDHTGESIPGSVLLGPSEFAISLPMDSRVKDDYERVLTSESDSIQEFINGTSTQADQRVRLLPKIKEVLECLSNVATHPDLNVTKHLNDSQADLRQEASWAEYSSAKFLLLSYLVGSISDRDIHLVIMVNGEKTQNVVERFLLGKGLAYTRPREEMGPGTNVEVSLAKGPLSFGVQSTRNDGIVETYKAPSAIIALDSSFNTKIPSVEHMRTTFARHGHLLPVVRLIVSNSSEHIELCFSSLPELQRVHLLLQYTTRLKNSVGDLQDDALGVSEDAEELVSYLSSDNFNAHWSLPDIEPLHIVDLEALQPVPEEPPSRPDVEFSPMATPLLQKRAFVSSRSPGRKFPGPKTEITQTEDSSEQTAKRPRIEEPQDASQLTESTKFPSQTLDGELRSLESNLVQFRSSHANEVQRLEKTLAETQARLQERDHVLEQLQHRYETRTRDFHKLRRERDKLVEAKTLAEQRSEKSKEELTKIKDERTQLRHELEQARAALKSDAGSMAAELETAREEIRRLTKENSGLERKADYEAKQTEYTREQYQTASNVAAQSSNENRQLRDENETLKRKVAGDASRLRELNLQHDEARHLARTLELEAALASREDLLRRKEEELREIRKNRPSTRSTSTQPRSPKWTASRPTSPGINNHGGNGSSLSTGRGSALRFSSEMTF